MGHCCRNRNRYRFLREAVASRSRLSSRSGTARAVASVSCLLAYALVGGTEEYSDEFEVLNHPEGEKHKQEAPPSELVVCAVQIFKEQLIHPVVVWKQHPSESRSREGDIDA